MKKVLLLFVLGTMLSGCFVAPIAMLGPVISVGTSGSLTQAAIQTGLNYGIKKATGKSMTEHALDVIISQRNTKSAYFPKNKRVNKILSKSIHSR